MFKFTELKCDSITNALLAFLKILGTLAGISAMYSIFRIAMGSVDWKAPIT